MSCGAPTRPSIVAISQAPTRSARGTGRSPGGFPTPRSDDPVRVVGEPTPLSRQRRAIEADLGPVLVVAGPGAGKTYCLIHRVGHLIGLGISPGRICAVTFTNKAAEEISSRLRHTLGTSADEITRGTLHRLCLAILRRHPEAVGLRPGFGVADDEYQRHLLARLGVPSGRRGGLLGLFGRHRLQGCELAPAEEREFQSYLVYLRHRSMVDFDDILVLTRELLRSRSDLAEETAAHWDYVLVDEFQDLNLVQYDILKQLSSGHGNVFAVGDDEQSIYSWTGADPRVLVRFREDYGIAAPIVLERNHRCSRKIFAAARLALANNPTLFEKDLVAERVAEYDVTAAAFPDEEQEADWLIADLRADQRASGLPFGQYAVLYRKHELGAYLEGRLLRADVPCRLARGRAATDDAVVGFTVAALRVIRDPADSAAVRLLAQRVLPSHVLQDVDAALAGEVDPLTALRDLARRRPRTDPDTKRLWRLVYQTENLLALARAHTTLATLVEDVLAQGVSRYRNPLEEMHEDLTDPAELAAAVALADSLSAAERDGRPIHLEPLGGLELALRGLLIAAGVRGVAYRGEHPEPGAVVIGPADGGPMGLALTTFKALQLLEARGLEDSFRSYVAFDVETTDDDPAACEIVEIGAVKVVDGALVDRFHTLVRPGRAISPGAQRVHGYADADVRHAPALADVWPSFERFSLGLPLVAHNGQRFDVPVLKRQLAELGMRSDAAFFDSLPLARSLSPGRARLEDLAHRFGVDPGRKHRALDDAATLAQVFRELRGRQLARARKSVLTNLLDYLGLALALDPVAPKPDECATVLGVARIHSLGRFSSCLEFYAVERERANPQAPSIEQLVERLGGAALRQRLQAAPDAAKRYPSSVARLRAILAGTVDRPGLEAQIAAFLERVALTSSEGIEADPNRVNLLTMHSTKGLEFSRVYMIGVEDYQLPGYRATLDKREDELQEARRLLYVGMTRARDRLVLTCAAQRRGLPCGGHRLLDEMRLEPETVPAEP